jgi:uncharacterized membrane protein
MPHALYQRNALWRSASIWFARCFVTAGVLLLCASGAVLPVWAAAAKRACGAFGCGRDTAAYCSLRYRACAAQAVFGAYRYGQEKSALYIVF